MSWSFDPSAWTDGVTIPHAVDYQHIASDLHTWKANVDAGAFGLANSAFMTLNPGPLPASPANGMLAVDGSNVLQQYYGGAWHSVAASAGISGTTNYIPKFTAAGTIGNSALVDDGTYIYTTTRNFGVGTARPLSIFHLFQSGTGIVQSASDTAPGAIFEGPNNVFNTTGNPANLVIIANSVPGADVGGTLAFGAKYSGNSYVEMAMIKMGKDNASAQVGGYLAFGTRTDPGNIQERMRITSGGNTGFGTVSPKRTVEVFGLGDVLGVGTSNDIGTVVIHDGSTVADDRAALTLQKTFEDWTATDRRISLNFQGGADDAQHEFGRITGGRNGAGNLGYLGFHAGQTDSSQLDQVRLLYNGNLGVGTLGALSKCDIAGGLAIGTYAGTSAAPANGMIVSNYIGAGNSAPRAQLDIIAAQPTWNPSPDSDTVGRDGVRITQGGAWDPTFEFGHTGLGQLTGHALHITIPETAAPSQTGRPPNAPTIMQYAGYYAGMVSHSIAVAPCAIYTQAWMHSALTSQLVASTVLTADTTVGIPSGGFQVSATTGLPNPSPNPVYLKIDSEWIWASVYPDGTHITVLQRGMFGSTIVNHTAGTTVYAMPVAQTWGACFAAYNDSNSTPSSVTGVEVNVAGGDGTWYGPVDVVMGLFFSSTSRFEPRVSNCIVIDVLGQHYSGGTPGAYIPWQTGINIHDAAATCGLLLGSQLAGGVSPSQTIVMRAYNSSSASIPATLQVDQYGSFNMALSGGMFQANVNTTSLPTLNNGFSLGWNRSSGGAELNFYNNSYGGGNRGFVFSQMLSLSNPALPASSQTSTYRDLLVLYGTGDVAMPLLPTTAPPAGSKKLWADAADSYVVKWAN